MCIYNLASQYSKITFAAIIRQLYSSWDKVDLFNYLLSYLFFFLIDQFDMKWIFFFVATVGLSSYGCQKRTHIYGFVRDENKKPIIGAKIAVVKANDRKPLKTDTLVIGYSHENGYQLNILSRRRYKNIRLVNPYLINSDLQDKYRISEPSKGRVVILDTDCCKVVIGRANEYGFLLKK